MSKKRAKSGTGSAGVSRWESGILSTPFEEETWKACLAFVVGNQLDDNEYTSILSSAVDSKLRKLFSVIHKKSLIEEVIELGNAKVKKPKDVPQFSEICETVKGEYLDKGEEIPLGLLAKLLKWKLLAIKDKDLKRREDEKKVKAVDQKDKKGKDAGGGKRARSKSPAKGKGKKSPEVPSPKKDSKLKKRGEEDEDNKYIDDEPDDGPQHYVLIEGFDQAPLLSLLTDLGINVNCIIRVQAEDYSLFEKRRKEQEEEEDEDDRPPEVIEEEKKKREKAEACLEKFWLQHEPLLKSATKGSKLQDIARLKYTVKNKIVPDDMKDNEQRTQFGTDMFEDVACMMYDLLDSERMYRHYKSNMKLIQIPVVESSQQGIETQSMMSFGGTAATMPPPQPPAGQPPTEVAGVTEPKPIVVSADVDTRYYTELMDTIPQESVSIPLIMHCMLEQVVATAEERGPPSDKNLIPREDGLEHSLAAHIDNMASKLQIKSDEKEASQVLNNQPANGMKMPSKSANTTPEFFHFGDKMSLRLKHLKSLNGFNPVEAELAMLDYIPVAGLREFPRPTAAVVKQRAARLQELLHHCSSGVVDQAEVDRAFKQFVFESLALRGTEEDGSVSKETVSKGIVWDDPYPLFVKKEKEDEKQEKDNCDVQKLTTENVQKAEEELKAKEATPELNITMSNSGILKTEGSKSRQGSASSMRSTVHFEKDAFGQPIIPKKETEPPAEGTIKPVEDEDTNRNTEPRPSSSRSNISVHDIGEKQMRNLDEWCYAEHFEPNVLIQVLEEAREMYPFMDTYYHKRDHTLLVVMHNPVGPNLKNHQQWDTKLHSDVGFRNYMEHVAENIKEWTQVEEAKYQAEMREKELAALRELALSRASSPAPTSRPTSSKGRRTQSPKKSRSKSPKGRRSASPAQTVDNLDPNSKNFMRPNSMKAWKVEQDKIREEEERKRLEKEKKGRKSARSRSASPKKSDGDDKKDKRPSSPSKGGSGRGSRKGDKDKKDASQPEPAQEEPVVEAPKEPERVYPFVGYDVGNNLIQASGKITTLFPNDGGQIRTESTQFINGPKFVKTSVLKDGHVFVIHIVDPRDKEDVEGEEESSPSDGGNLDIVTEKAEEEKQEKDQKDDAAETEGGEKLAKKKKEKPLSSFGSFTANLNDGMVLSFSNYGIEGKTKKAEEKQEVEIIVPMLPSPTPPPAAPSPKGGRGGSGKKGKKNQQQQQQQQAEAEKQAQLLAEQQQREEEERQKKQLEEEAKLEEPEIPPFQQLFVSCPDGLHVNYLLEPKEEKEDRDPNIPGRLLIRQCYSSKTSGHQPCEAPRQNPAMLEASRIITSEGAVIKLMKDGSTQVLFADGTVSYSPASASSSQFPMSPTMSRDPSPQRGGSSLSQRSDSAAKRSATKGAATKGVELVDQEQPPIPEPSKEWVTTTPTGKRIATKPDGNVYEPRPCLVYSATDPVSAEVLTTREDRVITVERPNGMQIVDHNEGTRITTYYKPVIFRQETEEEYETGETAVAGVREVKHVRVECAGYATVIFNSEDSIATTIFGNGTEIVAIPDGSYEILHCDGSRLAVNVDGTAKYIPEEGESGEPSSVGVYSMQHREQVIVETCDLDGNQFWVKWNGDMQSSIVPSDDGKRASIEGNGEEEGAGEGEEETAKQPLKMTHIPRFFVIHPDGSGTELLRQRDILPYIRQAGVDPHIAVLRDAIPEHPEIYGVTVMQPHTTGISEKWLAQFEEPNIIPKNLRSRDFAKLPAVEQKLPGPKFGTKVGRGVAVMSVPKPPVRGPVPVCPKQLQLRQFVEYKPMDEELRGKMRAGLEAYAKEMKQKEKEMREKMIKDPRSRQERVKSGDLLAHILAQLDDDSTNKAESGGEPSSQEESAKNVAARSIKTTEPVKPPDVKASGNAKELYEASTAPPPLPPPPKPKNKYNESDWERVRSELAEERACRDALINRTVPSYFESDWGQAFLKAEAAIASGEPAPDMEALTKDLPAGNRQGVNTAMSLPSTPSESPAAPSAQPGQTSSNSQPSDASESGSPVKAANGPSGVRDQLSASPLAQGGVASGSPSDIRPTNPTPGHATGQGTPTPLRPTNPTPGHAAQSQTPVRPGNPTPIGATDQGNSSHPNLPSETPSSYASFPAHPSTIPEHDEPPTARSDFTGSITPGIIKPCSQLQNNEPLMESHAHIVPSAGSDIVLTKSLLVDVNGEMRQEAVRLPAAILGQKPGALPNTRYEELEDPVRRKVFTSSIAGATVKRTADFSHARGFELVPGEVNFGTLREGCTYAFQVNLKNVGIESCRYKIRQPPPATGLQVVYTPGPVAAGMKAKLELVLYAIAVGVEGESGRGSIDHHLEITTETEVLHLPVSADILTATEYDDRTNHGHQPRTMPGVRLIATRPPSREGIIRPRREIPQEMQPDADNQVTH